MKRFLHSDHVIWFPYDITNTLCHTKISEHPNCWSAGGQIHQVWSPGGRQATSAHDLTHKLQHIKAASFPALTCFHTHSRKNIQGDLSWAELPPQSNTSHCLHSPLLSCSDMKTLSKNTIMQKLDCRMKTTNTEELLNAESLCFLAILSTMDTASHAGSKARTGNHSDTSASVALVNEA